MVLIPIFLGINTTIQGSTAKKIVAQKPSKQVVAPQSTATTSTTSSENQNNIDQLLKNFTTSVNAINARDPINFNTQIKKAYKDLNYIKAYEKQHGNSLTPEQEEQKNKALKKLPKKSKKIDQLIAELTSSLATLSEQSSNNIEQNVTHIQNLLKTLQEEVNKNPTVVISKEQKKSVDKAISSLPKSSKEADTLLVEFDQAVNNIPENSSAQSEELEKAVQADNTLLQYLKKTKPLLSKQQVAQIKNTAQRLKTKIVQAKNTTIESDHDTQAQEMVNVPVEPAIKTK